MRRRFATDGIPNSPGGRATPLDAKRDMNVGRYPVGRSSPWTRPSRMPVCSNRKTSCVRMTSSSIAYTSVMFRTFRVPSFRRAVCTMMSTAAVICSRIVRSGRSTPAMRTIVSIRRSMSSGLFAWPVESEPSCPMLIAWIMSRASPPRHSPTMMRSGRMCRAFLSRSRIVISPFPSRFTGRASSVTTWAWLSWSSAASSIVMIRSSFGMKDERTLSVVVLPEPVPPETKTFRRPSTQARRKSNISADAVPKPTRSATV